MFNGEDALAALQHKPFDVVLLDLRMPGMDGMDVLKAIKQAWPKSEVVVITGYPTVESAKEAVRLGAYDYLAKPVGPAEVISAASGAITQKKWALRKDRASPDATIDPYPSGEPSRLLTRRKQRNPVMNAVRKVLVVDDDPVVSKSFDRVLTRRGYLVVSAENGLEALNKVAREDYDAVFTDIKMPGMDGIEVAERMQARRPWTPVVIITGYGSAEHHARAEAAGVSGFLNKPLSPEMIEKSLDAALAAPAPAAVALPPQAAVAAAEADVATPRHEAEAAGERRGIGGI